MKKLNKYQWLIVISVTLFLLLWIVSILTEDNIVEHYHPLEVINNEIRVRGTGEILYRFVPVDGGKMDFEYTDTIVIHGDTTVLINSCIKEIHSFLIGETPVTMRLWDYVMKDIKQYEGNYIGTFFPQYKDSVFAYGWKQFIERLEGLTGIEFCLPTNYQWEYAARGGLLTKHYRYSGSNNIDDVAYYKNNSPKVALFRASKQKKANELGLYDMSGSVLELTTSPITEIYPTMSMLARKKIEEMKMGISRGGSFKSSEEECSVRHISSVINIVSGARLVLKTGSEHVSEIIFGKYKYIEDSEMKEDYPITIGWGLQHFDNSRRN